MVNEKHIKLLTQKRLPHLAAI